MIVVGLPPVREIRQYLPLNRTGGEIERPRRAVTVEGVSMDLHRVDHLEPERFVADHLVPRVPVVVTGEVPRWPAFGTWSWARFAERFGDRDVDVYDDWFVPTGIMRLADFVADRVGVAASDPRTSYVRWFSRHGHGPGRWSDDVLAELAAEWAQPTFLPTGDYVVPYTPAGTRVDVARDAFPYRGLFLSARGASTRLHRDPWAGAAALCQLVGTKEVRMYAPQQQAELTAAAMAGDRTGTGVAPALAGALNPGEALFIPDGWWHQVATLTDSISLTWNFVHRSVADRLAEHVASFPDDPELAVVAYFLAGRVPDSDASSPIALVPAAIAAR